MAELNVGGFIASMEKMTAQSMQIQNATQENAITRSNHKMLHETQMSGLKSMDGVANSASKLLGQQGSQMSQV
ncbi:MAG TPA: hypothetical protein DD979_04405 [Gammaproteobacteria bacterium]|jgi:hypothetical protein|nr:hypothetical protein [Gammaproteobacteria bacterium]